ncbi:uncharacterized protein PGRI_072050 [Penicillium griseofulvum]|uniref:Uncharacterized protein n=1 Tax=Penicillium patulum TaxID=5078 RepID=A0A135LYR6_PENPA|nr:uncharacterized protein PGRI_072050 [Penicillium griseofulvum]KXG54061.1 hypothetical protein PGRI_072050 [Penicillium griseofulvum]
MRSFANFAALSAILLQVVPALAAPAPGGARGGGDEWSNDGFWAGAGHKGDVDLGNENTGHGPGGHGGFDNTHCGNHIKDLGNIQATITATVTVTTDNDHNGSATVTQTISACTSTVTTTTGNNGGGSTVTKTDTLISTISRCTATTTALTTVTTNGPTVTVTTNGPVSTTTETIGAITVTDPGVTETQTVTQTITDTTTFTENQVVTEFSTVTTTNTFTLEVTTTVTSDDCNNTGNPNPSGSLDYGTCSDPTIKWEYGLDGRTEWAFTTNNQKDFPFGSSPTVGAPTDLICNRLRSPCNAPQATIDQCYAAERAVANLTGEEAVNVWNSMMT